MEALSRGGRYKTVRDNLMVKEVYLGKELGQRRFVVVFNPAEAKKDKATREKTLTRIDTELATIASLPESKREKACARLLDHTTMGRFLEKKADGRVVVKKAKDLAEEKLDGKYLLSSSSESMSAEDIAQGY